MGRRSTLREEIGQLNTLIDKYNSDIVVLTDAKTVIKAEYDKIKEIYNSVYEYDVTKESQWLGNMSNTMDGHRDTIVEKIGGSKMAIRDFYKSIDSAIAILETKIQNCKDSIASKQSEIDRIDAAERAAATASKMS